MLRRFTYGLRRQVNKALVIALMMCGSMTHAEQVHLLALGDSLTQGYGLIEQEGFVPQLRAWLTERGHDVRIVNGGVSGDTTAGGLARVEWSLTPEIQGVIVALGGNDLLRGIDPEVSRSNLDGILTVAQDRSLEVLLIGMSAPGNYGPEFKAAFDGMFPELSSAYGTLYLESFFAGLMADDQSPEAMRAVMQPDGIHPNARGVSLIVEVVGPLAETLIARIQSK